ncbi:hypothetical protein [Streptomyces stelliscabiei]|uniref:hypothetical protein n=1 Tax=Streptomyces stelliscabiei TaxID=146820 RepID=UPI002FEF0482
MRLREAYESLDADGIKALSEQRRSIVAAMSGQASALAAEAGHRPVGAGTAGRFEATLRAVPRRPRRQPTVGHRSGWRAPSPARRAFPGGPRDRAGRPTRARARAVDPPASARSRAKDEVAERRRLKEEQLGRAREAAEAAERRLRDLRTARTEAEALLERAA